jgi:hypothetical protein
MQARTSASQRSCRSCASSRRGSTSSTLLEPVAWSCFRILASKDCSVILSGVGGRAASDDAVEGSLPSLDCRCHLRELSPRSREQWWKLPAGSASLHAGRDPSTALLLRDARSSRFAQDDRGEGASSRRSGTSSTLLEPVAWSCFRILASNDASRISMVMVRSLGLGRGKGRV